MLQRVMHWVGEGGPFATVTAFKGELDGKTLTLAENRARNRLLEQDLRRLGLPWLNVDGFWKTTGKSMLEPEESYFVPKMSRAQAVELGHKYRQESVIVRDDKGFDLVSSEAPNKGQVLKRFTRMAVSEDMFVEAFSRMVGSNVNLKFVGPDEVPDIVLKERVTRDGMELEEERAKPFSGNYIEIKPYNESLPGFFEDGDDNKGINVKSSDSYEDNSDVWV